MNSSQSKVDRPRHPATIAVNWGGLDHFPKGLRRYLPWSFTWKDGVWAKVPRDAENKWAKWSDPAILMTFDDAKELCQIHNCTGIGYFFRPGDPLAAVDLDKCINQDGICEPWALEILAQFPDTFIELSPSGTGYHIWCLGATRDKQRYKKRWDKPGSTRGEGVDNLDGSHGCYLTMTGVAPAGSSLIPQFRDHQAALLTFREAYLTAPIQTSPVRQDVTVSPSVRATGDDLVDRVIDALRYIPADDYNDWFKTGLSLKRSGIDFSVFEEYCRKSSKYDPVECRRKWDRDLNGPKRGLRALFEQARANGWQPSVIRRIR